MKKVNLLLISLVTLVSLSIGFSSCGEGTSIYDNIKVVDESSKGYIYTLYVKNISDRTFDPILTVRFTFYDGTTETLYSGRLNDFRPGDVQQASFVTTNSATGIKSWQFVR